ncbi:hypothetical protein [Streptomyces sp. CBMA152]|uniref:hypothetical protein n=1 Tax=Streptomyces sp. CBMA152 TaxID=1896312 RepID=UPI0016614B9F|nr:hypothetical protein [Streptomyces sp. CBMA152]MBD0743889.1 hypothetical protein [Streptomyces sp. CBMA152]
MARRSKRRPHVDAFVEFGRTGRLGALHGGAWLTEVAAVHGTPWTGGRVYDKRRWPHWFGYGDVSLCVCGCRRIEMISIPTWHRKCLVPGDRPDRLRRVPPLTYGMIVPALDTAGVEWHLDEYPGLPQRTVVTEPVDGRVEFVFTTEEYCYESDREIPLRTPVLNKIVAAAAPHECPPIPPGTPDDGWGS